MIYRAQMFYFTYSMGLNLLHEKIWTPFSKLEHFLKSDFKDKSKVIIFNFFLQLLKLKNSYLSRIIKSKFLVSLIWIIIRIKLCWQHILKKLILTCRQKRKLNCNYLSCLCSEKVKQETLYTIEKYSNLDVLFLVITFIYF